MKPETTETKKLKCKFCAVKVNRWKTVGKRKVDGFETMKEHILMHHEVEAEKMEMTW